MGEFAKSHNLLIDSNNTLEEKVHRLSLKVLDLEDRSRRNNIRLRGIPESVLPAQLPQFLTEFMALVLPSASSLDLTIDRIHRIPKPRHLGAQIPRDTLARVHFFHIKENFLRMMRNAPNLPDRFKDVSIYPDLSAATMLKHWEFQPFTKLLWDNNIAYLWGFPVKHIIIKDGVTTVCQDPKAACDLLIAWNLLPNLSSPISSEPGARPQMVTPLWSEKRRKSRAHTEDG